MTDEPEDIDDGEEDFDWGEAERKAQMWDKLAEVHNRVMNQKFVPVPLIKLPKGTRFDITTFSDGHDPMECTLLDPATGLVTVRDNYYFPQSTTCVLWGSDGDLDGKGAQLPGIIKHNAKVVFEKDGKRMKETGPDLRIMRLALHIPNSPKPFNPWEWQE